jgi:hypothetical protein
VKLLVNREKVAIELGQSKYVGTGTRVVDMSTYKNTVCVKAANSQDGVCLAKLHTNREQCNNHY